MHRDKVFGVEIGGAAPGGVAAALELPATRMEIFDALQMARVKDVRDCKVDLLEVGKARDYLHNPIRGSCIGENPDLGELNFLARCLAAQNRNESMCFEGMVRMERERAGVPIPLSRLINISYSLDNCVVAPGVRTDAQLGDFLYENEMLSEDTHDMARMKKVTSRYAEQYMSVLGSVHRAETGGVFAAAGYVENLGNEIKEVFTPGQTPPLDAGVGIPQGSDCAMLLQVSKSGGAVPVSDEFTEVVALPTDSGALLRAVGQVGAKRPERCEYAVVDCVAPQLVRPINDAMGQDCASGFTLANELAGQLRRMSEDGELLVYKAMLDRVKPDALTLMEALALSRQTGGFKLREEVASPEAYAREEIQKSDLPAKEALLNSGSLYSYGETLMAERGEAMTAYGMLVPKEGPELGQATSEREESGMVMG